LDGTNEVPGPFFIFDCKNTTTMVMMHVSTSISVNFLFDNKNIQSTIDLANEPFFSLGYMPPPNKEKHVLDHVFMQNSLLEIYTKQRKTCPRSCFHAE
jgi:hypothetical protein